MTAFQRIRHSRRTDPVAFARVICFRHVFEAAVEWSMEEGLVCGQGFAVDASMTSWATITRARRRPGRIHSRSHRPKAPEVGETQADGTSRRLERRNGCRLLHKIRALVPSKPSKPMTFSTTSARMRLSCTKKQTGRQSRYSFSSSMSKIGSNTRTSRVSPVPAMVGERCKRPKGGF